MAHNTQQGRMATGRARKLAAWCALALTVACAGAPRATPLAAAALTDAQLKERVAAAHKARQWDEVLRLRRGAQSPVPTMVEVLAIGALWNLSRDGEARRDEDRVLAQPLPGDATAAALDLARYHLSTRKQAQAAWRWLAAGTAGGCQSAAACKLAQRVLIELPVDVADWGTLATSAAPGDPAKRAAFALRLATEMKGNHFNLQRANTWSISLAAQQPSQETLWLAAYRIARLLPGPETRKAWRDALMQPATPTVTLVAIATSAQLSDDRDTAAELLGHAATRPDGVQALAWRAQLAARRDDVAGLLAVAEQAASATLPDQARLAVVRALLVARQTPVAQRLLQAWTVANAAPWLGLEAELSRQLGAMDRASAQVAAIDDATGDRSLGWLLVGQLWQKAHPGEALRALERASDTPGLGQRAAARLRARRLLPGAPTAVSTAAVRQYARLLATRDALPGPGALGEEPEPTLTEARDELMQWLARPDWRETAVSILRDFSDAEVASPEWLREFALWASQRDDLGEFLTADARARSKASAELVELSDKALIQQLSRRGLWLARWLQDAGVDAVEEGTWGIAAVLLDNGFGALGLHFLDVARTIQPNAELSPAQLVSLATSGGAAAVLELVRGQPENSPDPAKVQAEALALLALDRAAEARKLLIQQATRPDLPLRGVRPLLDVASNYGLCDAVAALALRAAQESDLSSLRVGLDKGLTCARQQADHELAKNLVKAAFGSRLEPSRIETACAYLVQQGFDSLALQVFPQLAQLRPLNDESALQWAQALIKTGLADDATELLRRSAAARGPQSRLWLRAWDLLENEGQTRRSIEFAVGALRVEPDRADLRARLVGLHLRLGQLTQAAVELRAAIDSGMDEKAARAILELSRRAHAQRAMLDVVHPLADPDRDTAWLRGELAADLGDRATVLATIAQLKAKHAGVSADAVQWLQRVGLLHEARQAAIDAVSAEPVGSIRDRLQLLISNLDLRHDPASMQETLGIVRVYLARALNREQAAMEAASVLAELGWSREAQALASTLGKLPWLQFAAMAGQFAWDDGKFSEARRLWGQVRAASTLDPTHREMLRVARLTLVEDLRHSPMFRAMWLCWRDMEQRGLYDDLLPWVEDLLQLAPESELLQAQHIQWLISAGYPERALAAWEQARRELPAWSDSLTPTAHLLARELGADKLIAKVPQEGIAVRTPAWWLSLAATVDPSGKGLLPLVHRLAQVQPDMRAELALRLASQGDAAGATQALGQNPLICEGERCKRATAAVAATVCAIAGQQPTDPKAVRAGHERAVAQLQAWLGQGRGSDAAAQVAFELTRQGHPELAQVALERAPAAALRGQTDALQRRLLAMLGTASDAEVVDAALEFLAGNRSIHEYDEERGFSTWSDDVFALLTVAGRPTAAAQLAARLRAEEPGSGAPDELPGPGPLPPTQKARLLSPATMDEWPAMMEDLPFDLALAALSRAVLRGPRVALQAATALAAKAEEPWRVWTALARAAGDIEDRDLARKATAKAAEQGAPAASLACLQARQLERGGDPGAASACWRHRRLAAVADPELGDLATAIAHDPAGTFAAELAQEATRSSARTLANLVSAWSARAAALGAAGKQALGTWVGRVLDQLGPSRQALAVVSAMEDLGDLGLGQRGIDVARRMLALHPTGRSGHNDYAYALYLASADLNEAVAHAQLADATPGGDVAMAALDTYAAILARMGKTPEALQVQRRALASAATEWLKLYNGRRNQRSHPPIALPLVRYAEMLLAAGHTEQARLIAVAAARMTDGEDREDPSAQARLRRVLQATLSPLAAGTHP